VRFDEAGHDFEHAGAQGVGLVGAVGEEGIVGGVDVSRVRAQAHDLAEDGEAAETGIEDEDGWRRH
jgi:hypothetical protein